jgi:hypothetical protein
MTDKKTLLIIPYRNRKEDLATLLPQLRKHYSGHILIAEQDLDGMPFNLGAIYNAAIKESEGFDNFILHSVDMMPVNVDYSHTNNPTLLATEASQFGYKLPYKQYFGGVVIIPKKRIGYVNGFSNKFWGWGCEDDEIRHQFYISSVKILHRKCRFESIPHERNYDEKLIAKNRALLKEIKKNGRDSDDGLSNVKYTVTDIKIMPTLTHIKFDLDQMK